MSPNPITITSTTEPNEEPAIDNSNPLFLEDDPERVNPNIEEVPTDERMVPETKLTHSRDSSKFMRDFFNSVSYYYIVNSLYKFFMSQSIFFLLRLRNSYFNRQ